MQQISRLNNFDISDRSDLSQSPRWGNDLILVIVNWWLVIVNAEKGVDNDISTNR